MASSPKSDGTPSPAGCEPKKEELKNDPLPEGVDFYVNEDGFFVFTEAYHLKRGTCCGSGCKHCPY